MSFFKNKKDITLRDNETFKIVFCGRLVEVKAPTQAIEVLNNIVNMKDESNHDDFIYDIDNNTIPIIDNIDIKYNIDINNPYEIGEYSATGLSRYVLFTISGSTDVNMTSSPESASPDIPVVQTNQLSLGYVFVSDNNVVDTTTVGQINIQYFENH